MAAKLYKYAGPDVLSKHFSVSGSCNFKCSFPAEFNDPYELFLTIDYDQDPKILAFYNEVIGDIPQRPTTCFSKSPSVVPMWAHYAHNHRGVVIEVDEASLEDHFSGISIDDVDYREGPDPKLLNQLKHAHMTRKPRHTYFLQKAVFGAAYFTKHVCWDYEQERRLVAPPDSVVDRDGMKLLPCPEDCVTALIVGCRATDETKSSIGDLAQRIDCSYYEMRLSKSSSRPYFLSSTGEPTVFEDGSLTGPLDQCTKCQEPVTTDKGTCAWCAIEEDHIVDAAGGNMMRALADAGLLEGYYEGMERTYERRADED